MKPYQWLANIGAALGLIIFSPIFLIMCILEWAEIWLSRLMRKR